MMLLGVDMNGTRIRVVHGPAADFPLPLQLEPCTQELPMILSLANGVLEMGQAGVRLCRVQPHMTCHGFLPQVGASESGRGEVVAEPLAGGRHDLDATGAMQAGVEAPGADVPQSRGHRSRPVELSLTDQRNTSFAAWARSCVCRSWVR